MYKPQLSDIQKNRSTVANFSGYNKNLVIGENEFYDEENITSDFYPVLSPRNIRAKFSVSGNSLSNVFSKSKLCYIKNNKLYYGGVEVEGINLPDIQKERQLVSLGAKLLIFPDKLYVNTADLTDYGSLEASLTTRGSGAGYGLCMSDGTLYVGYTASRTAPKNPSDAALWVDTSKSSYILKQYVLSEGMWSEIPETYVRILVPGIGNVFNQYDTVKVSNSAVECLNTNLFVVDKRTDYLVVPGIIAAPMTQTEALTVERKMPDMDFFCENGNRVWGCSSKKNEIYASKLGDPTNWNSFNGISTDSYAVSLGTDGEFTGAISFRGYAMFFKENCVHKVYGANPPYSVTASYLRGVQKGSSKSLVTVNETLLYKSPGGICIYDGGLPIGISDEFGTDYYSNAVGGALRDKYYICMTSTDNKRVLFTYDCSKNVWHKEDEIDVKCFAQHNSNLYFIAVDDNTNRLFLADGVNKYGNFAGELSGFSYENDITWSAVTGYWGLSLSDNKYYSGISVRLTAKKDASLDVYFEYDSNGEWVHKASLEVKKTGSVRLPFITPRCDHLRIKFKGKGDIKIFSISRTVENGSGINV